MSSIDWLFIELVIHCTGRTNKMAEELNLLIACKKNRLKHCLEDPLDPRGKKLWTVPH